ncbi:Leucine-rich repeat (LRR) family protein, partial [Striga hermonthica]
STKNPSVENHSTSKSLPLLTLQLIILLSFPVVKLGSSCHPTDKRALLEFKKTITDDPSHLLHTWAPHTDCCTQWEGVSCDPITGRAINLTRPGLFSDDDSPVDTSMSGKLSPFLGNLTFLRLLDLSNLKYLSGPIPTELGRLAHLTQMFPTPTASRARFPPLFETWPV